MRCKRLFIGLSGVTLVLNILAWNSTEFCDWYRRWIFDDIETIYGHFSSMFSFSVGERMLIMGVLLVFIAVILAIVLLFGRGFFRKEMTRLTAITKIFYHVFLWLLLLICIVMTCNCFILYHCSDFEASANITVEKEYTIKELVILRDYIIRKANALSKEMERNDNGYLIYEEDLLKQAKIEMTKMGEIYPLLSGYYPTPKRISSSKFLSQQYMMGYYFPFSMEANYNGEMYISNIPVTLCHELSHVKGFMYEDDANFIGYQTCVTSDDPFFQYSGYLSVISYLNTDLYNSLDKNQNRYKQYVQTNSFVKKDSIFLTEEAWIEVEKSAVVSTKTLKKASKTFLDTNLNMNGIEEGIASYGNVVEKLLHYYDGWLY